jgi:hypothetical protein
MAEMVTIAGQQYKKRNPLGVLGLTIITLGIYFLIWYYKINDEVQRAENDQTMSPTRSPHGDDLRLADHRSAVHRHVQHRKHVQAMETRFGVGQTVEPALTVVLMLVFTFGNGIYIQEHLNRAWDAAGSHAPAQPWPTPPPPNPRGPRPPASR